MRSLTTRRRSPDTRGRGEHAFAARRLSIGFVSALMLAGRYEEPLSAPRRGALADRKRRQGRLRPPVHQYRQSASAPRSVPAVVRLLLRRLSRSSSRSRRPTVRGADLSESRISPRPARSIRRGGSHVLCAPSNWLPSSECRNWASRPATTALICFSFVVVTARHCNRSPAFARISEIPAAFCTLVCAISMKPRSISSSNIASDASTLARSASQQFKRIGMVYEEAKALAFLGVALMQMNRFAEALETFRAVSAGIRERRQPVLGCRSRSVSGGCLS